MGGYGGGQPYGRGRGAHDRIQFFERYIGRVSLGTIMIPAGNIFMGDIPAVGYSHCGHSRCGHPRWEWASIFIL